MGGGVGVAVVLGVGVEVGVAVMMRTCLLVRGGDFARVIVLLATDPWLRG